MDDSDFWRDLAEKFRTADPSGILSAEWHYSEEALAASPAMPKWHLAGPNQDQRTRSIQKDFDALARRGGPKIQLFDPLDKPAIRSHIHLLRLKNHFVLTLLLEM